MAGKGWNPGCIYETIASTYKSRLLGHFIIREAKM
jgi:hypothetical protein